MPTKKDNHLAWGITLLVFGVLFLIRQFHILPSGLESAIFEIRNYPLIMGIIFLWMHNNKTIGWVLIVVALLFRLSDIIRLTKDISDYIWPLLLIVAGGIIILGNKKK